MENVDRGRLRLDKLPISEIIASGCKEIRQNFVRIGGTKNT